MIKLYQLGAKAIGNTTPKIFLPSGKDVLISYTFPTKENDFTNGEIRFKNVCAYRWTTHMSCSVEMIEAYDKIVEIDSSEWAKELRELQIEKGYPVQVHHYRVFFDSEGCYEIVAESFLVNEK